MNPEQIYRLSKLRSAEIEERARQSRLVAGRAPEPLRRIVRTRLAGARAHVRISRPTVTRPNRADVPAGR